MPESILWENAVASLHLHPGLLLKESTGHSSDMDLWHS